MKTRVRRGFTLPEVLVTVTVVAVLAAVVVPAVTGYVNRGNSPATQQDITQLQNAVNGYVTDTRAYPTHLSDLTTTTGHGPYLAAPVTRDTGSTSTDSAAFKSSGLNVTFADSLLNGNGYLSLFVSSSTSCAHLLALDSLFDSGSSVADTLGLVTWTAAASPTGCHAASPTGTFTGAKFKFMAIGK